MADRHAYAVQAVGISDVIEVCRLLAHSVQDALKEQVYPHQDAACRVICAHLAALCNADMPFLKHYQECYEYCCRQMEKDRLAAPDAVKEVQPELKPS